MSQHPGGPERIGAAMFFLFLALSAHPALPSVGNAWAEEPAIRTQIDVKQLSALVCDGKQSDRARIKAAKVLAESEDPKEMEPLFAAIRDSNERPLLRAAITRTLGRTPQKALAATFLGERLDDKREISEVRTAAAETVGHLKEPSSKEILLQATKDPDPNVRLAARGALLELGGAGIDRGALLIATLQETAHPGVARASASRQLGEMKDPRALPALREALQEKGPEIPEPKNPGELFAAWAAVKGHVPAAAARALGKVGDPVAVPALLAAAGRPDAELRAAVFEALAALNDRRAIPAAREALAKATEFRVRRWAAVLLKEVGAREALPDLRQALSDPDPGVRLQAAQAVGAMRDQEAKGKLEEALQKETHKEVREAISRALERFQAGKH